jgi:hypothetical protein
MLRVLRGDKEKLGWYGNESQRQLCMLRCLERDVEWDDSSEEDVKGKGSLNGN